ncbi:hypothetical protein M758_5G113700 [Ceratodon purpureus]|nr:hypothetical protein M758_5G113700 [Ceratodon purpureus]
MATELQSGLNATEKQGVDSEAPVGKPPSGHEVPATEVASVDGESYVSGHQGGEIPVGDGHSETADLSDSNYSNASSAGSTPRYEKAEAFLEARKERVEVEANAYLESEIRKVNARAHTAQALAEKKRMHEEAKALELKKREELHAEQLLSNAEVKADKIMEHAKQEAAKVKAHVYEQTERTIADVTARAEREKAAEEEARKTGIAELVDEVEQMKATGELPIHEKKGVITRLKEKVVGHH